MLDGFKQELAGKSRAAWALGIYRWLIGCGLLIAGFSAFPSYVAPIAFAVLALNLGVEASVGAVNLLLNAQNAIDDSAERKTRHTIVLAADNARQGIPYDPYLFWSAVDHRVQEEQAEASPPTPPVGFFKSTALVVGSLLWRAVCDLIGIGLALAFTGNA